MSALLFSQQHPQKEKGPTHVGPVMGLTPLRTGPIPKAPGGWGLRNPEPKGPGQRSDRFLAIPRGVRLAEVGHHCDSANDPVTCFFVRWRTFGRAHPEAASFDPLAETH